VGVATVRVDDELAWWVARTYPGVESAPSDTTGFDGAPVPDDALSSTVFTTPYADPDALVTWVLSLGRRAEILGPPVLRDHVRARLDLLETVHA
jgi:predicted DNA-binding transcriptional regulator YafY